jgi:hypothetical protein
MKIFPPFTLALPLLATGCWDGVLGPFSGIELAAFDSTFQFVYTDFNADSLHPVEPPPPEQQIGSLLYRASVIPDDTSLSSAPMSLWVRVNVQNATPDRIELPVVGCTVWPETYEGPQRAGKPLWVPQGECMQEPYSRFLGPGDTAQFSFLAYDVMLADAMPDGRYYWNAHLRRQSDTLILRAGSGDVRLRVPGLRYRVQVRLENRHVVRTQVVLTNLNQEVTRVTFGDCSLSLALYRDAERTELAHSWYAQDVCLDYLAVADIEADASLQPDEFTRLFQASRLADAGLNARQYYLSVALSHNARTYEFPVGTMEIW